MLLASRYYLIHIWMFPDFTEQYQNEFRNKQPKRKQT